MIEPVLGISALYLLHWACSTPQSHISTTAPGRFPPQSSQYTWPGACGPLPRTCSRVDTRSTLTDRSENSHRLGKTRVFRHTLTLFSAKQLTGQKKAFFALVLYNTVDWIILTSRSCIRLLKIVLASTKMSFYTRESDYSPSCCS